MQKNKINTKVLSGFVELLPEQQAVFDAVKTLVESTYKKYGFVAIDTPVIERSEVLFAKAGGEIEKEIYSVAKTGRDDLALRFDLTVPFARYVAEHYAGLAFPFKRYHIGKSYRGERAQKARYREFYQADADVVAEDGLPVAYDAEIIMVLAAAIKSLSDKFGFGGFRVHVSNRKVLEGFFEELGVDAGKKPALMALVDRKMKIPPEEFDAELAKLLDPQLLDKLKVLLDAKEFSALHGDNPKFAEGVSELAYVEKALKAAGVPVEVDFSIVRGLDYYTGTVFETFLDEHRDFGSVASGGRYENLCSNYTERNIVGVGGSIGLSRLFVPLIEEGKISLLESSGPDILIAPQGSEYYSVALAAEHEIAGRVGGVKVSAIYSDKKFKKVMDHANKIGAKFVVIIGGDEMEKGALTIKDMATGEQRTMPLEGVVSMLEKH
jgi:histidyl-tRNA synthetase